MYLGLGSNVGDSEVILTRAIEGLRLILDELVCSSVYITKPRYVTDQPDFFNLVVGGNTSLSPVDLLKQTQSIEASLGRDRSKERLKGPRTIDIDILLYGSDVISSPELVIPHPGLKERAFVLVPLLEIAPELLLPGGGASIKSLSDAISGQGIYLHAKPPV